MSPREVDVKRLIGTRQIVYLLMAIAVIVPFFIAVPSRFEPKERSIEFFTQVDQLEPGSHVLISFDFDPAARAELYPMGVAILRHCFKKDLIPVVMTHWPEGLGLSRRACELAAEESLKLWGEQKVSGRDYVLLGFKTGATNLILNMGEDLKGAFPKDYYNQPTATMEALEGVDSLKDIELAIDLAAGVTVDWWMAYGSDRFGFPLAAGTTGIIAPQLYPFLPSGSDQLKGILAGLRGAADYEKLLEKPDTAGGGMKALSATHVLLIVLIIGANVRFLFRRLTGKEGN